MLSIQRDPVYMTGRYYALVQFHQAIDGDCFRVRHYAQSTQTFDGPEEIVLMPRVIASRSGYCPFSNRSIEASPLNQEGWYIYGTSNSAGTFVVQAIAPRRLLQPSPDRIITGHRAALNYVNFQYWRDVIARTGTVQRVLLLPDAEHRDASKQFGQGERLLVMHLFGGIGGRHPEFAPLGIYFGHFSFGQAWVMPEPLTGELCFDIEYRQIYTNNPNGTVAGTHHWTRYMGNRQFGWVGCRPVVDMLVRFPPLTQDYDFDGIRFSPMDWLMNELAVMAARYRVGDGTGMTFRNAVNSCVQDSAQALYNGLRQITLELQLNPSIRQWLRSHPHHPQTQRFWQLVDLAESLKANLEPFGFVRSDWKFEELTLGRFVEETPGQSLLRALASWRSVLPRLANDVIAMVLLQLGASLWILGVNQAGGENPDIEGIAPTNFTFRPPKVKRVSRYDRSGGS
jgi:predicted Abi (CAAX) family protease